MASASAGGGGAATEVFDDEVVPSSLEAAIAPILRVANAVEKERPRVAYLCRFYAFEKAHRLDENGTGRGVRQFKTALLQRLEREDGASVSTGVKQNDEREIESFYKHYYEMYVLDVSVADRVPRVNLKKAYRTAQVLFEVLCAVFSKEGS